MSEVNVTSYTQVDPQSGDVAIGIRSGGMRRINLGTAAAADLTTSATDTTAGRVTRVGDFGVGNINPKWPNVSLNDLTGVGTGRYYTDGTITDKPDGNGVVIYQTRLTDPVQVCQFFLDVQSNDNIYYRRTTGGTLAEPTWDSWRKLYHTGNVTVDGDGFLKTASPIIRLYTDSIEQDMHDGATLTHTAKGVYRIKGTEGFAQEGWYIENYKDANGNVKCFVEYEYTKGIIELRTYEPTGTGWKAEKGAPKDIDAGRYITLRLHVTPEPDDVAKT